MVGCPLEEQAVLSVPRAVGAAQQHKWRAASVSCTMQKGLQGQCWAQH